MCGVAHSTEFLHPERGPAPEPSAFRQFASRAQNNRIAQRGTALRGFPHPTETRAVAPVRLSLIHGRFLDGATFVFPNVQLAPSLPSIFSARAFSCHNIVDELASTERWKGWDSPSISCHRMLSFTLNNLASCFYR